MDARKQMSGLIHDLLVVDVMMPGEDGVTFTRALRSGDGPEHAVTVPILILTAMSDAEHRIEGLESGADDYLAKPFEPRELLLRIQALLRRAAPATPDEAFVLTELLFGDFRFDLKQNLLWQSDGGSQETIVRLTEAEATMLRIFAESPGETLSREDLVERAEVNGGERTVDVQITRLRRKIEPDVKYPRFLQTVRGRGYVFRTDT